MIFLQGYGKWVPGKNFLIGSNSKSFTALAILILQENDLLNVNDPVIHYLPWFTYTNKESSDRVLIRNLLDHTSGIPKKLGMINPLGLKDMKEFYASLLKRVNPESEPGKQYEYSNLNYELLGMIVAKVSGKSYADFVKTWIFLPLGMDNTYADVRTPEEGNLAESYQYLLYYPWIRETIRYSQYYVPAGFISSNTTDMCTYLRNLIRSNKGEANAVFSRSITQQLFHPDNDIGLQYAFGWENKQWYDFECFTHTGLTESFSSAMLILPGSDLGIMISTDINNYYVTHDLADGILRILSGREETSYPRATFYVRNSLPLFALYIIIVFIFTLIKWIRKHFPVGYCKKTRPNFWLVINLALGISLLVYFPRAFSTPFAAIIDFDPNAGVSILVFCAVLLGNAILTYFIRSKGERKQPLS